MKKAAPINVIVHYPTTEEGWRDLRHRVAQVQANVITDYIEKLHCPTWQKIKLLDALLEDIKKENRSDRVSDTCEAHNPREFCGTPGTPNK